MLDARYSPWYEWATYNLAMGVDREGIRHEMQKAELPGAEIENLFAEIEGSPLFSATMQIARKCKMYSDLNDALIEMESQVFDFSNVARRRDLSSEEFHEKYYAANRPVVIQDVVSSWPAIRKWSLEHLKNTFGHEEVTFQFGRSKSDHRDSFVDHTRRATLAEYIDLLDDNSNTETIPYLIAHDRILDKPGFKPLFEDIVFDERYFDPTSTHSRVFFWLGPKNSATPMHRDLGNVFMAQIAGRKKVTLVPSKEIHLVYNEAGYHSEADFDNLDLEEFPLLKKAHCMELVLDPGEMLLIPVGWWHAVRSLDTTITITGNNFKFPNQLRPIFD